ncbi:MAG: GAF domain-containing protein [Leptolyngbya sp.]|nr:GAF domain-containing protein [Candidatus Melainabacteria bacterium]
MAKDGKAKPVKSTQKAPVAEKKESQDVSLPGHDHAAHAPGDCATAVNPGSIGHDDPETRGDSLTKFEAELNKREVDLIEREIKSLRQQEELDRLRPLSGLYRVVRAMASERRLDSLLDVITRETQVMLRCDRCSVFVLDAQAAELWTQVAMGLVGHRMIRIPITGNSIVAECARTARMINIPDAYQDPRFDPAVDRNTGYQTSSVLCVPMLARGGEVIGVFQVLNKQNGPFTNEDEDWLEGLTAVAAGLIEQAQAYGEIERFVDKTLETLAQTIDQRDPLTAGHSIRVTNYSLLVGQAMNVPDDDIDVLRYSAMMHDYGKIGVPEKILWKDGRLTPEEYATVQKHASITYDLLSNLPFTRRLKDVPFVASCHHEKVDGSGYYRGLKGDDIPFLSRIIAVADVFDALTSVRHYRNRMPIEKVAEIMNNGRDNHFDSSCVDAFFQLPCHRVIAVLESERDRAANFDAEVFKQLSWQRLVELVSGANPKRGEEGINEAFDRIYNAGLPADYQSLD